MIMFSKNKPVRLYKKTSMREKIALWYHKNRDALLVIGVILFFIFFFTLLFFITPHVESGHYYYFKV